MPKKVSKSVLQKVNQKVKQTVNINIPTPIPRRRRVTKPKVMLPVPSSTSGQTLNTGTMLSSNFVPAGYMAQSGNASMEPIPQSQHHRLGRIERTIDDLYSNVSNIQTIRSIPVTSAFPINQPMAYDDGFENITPINFNENRIRSSSQNLASLPTQVSGLVDTFNWKEEHRDIIQAQDELQARIKKAREQGEREREEISKMYPYSQSPSPLSQPSPLPSPVISSFESNIPTSGFSQNEAINQLSPPVETQKYIEMPIEMPTENQSELGYIPGKTKRYSLLTQDDKVAIKMYVAISKSAEKPGSFVQRLNDEDRQIYDRGRNLVNARKRTENPDFEKFYKTITQDTTQNTIENDNILTELESRFKK